jgi:predicted RNase H-like nuclease
VQLVVAPRDHLLSGRRLFAPESEVMSALPLGRYRGSSVFPAPVRSALTADSWADACALSRASALQGKAISKQTFAILPKIREIDNLLQTRTELRAVVRDPRSQLCRACWKANDLS